MEAELVEQLALAIAIGLGVTAVMLIMIKTLEFVERIFEVTPVATRRYRKAKNRGSRFWLYMPRDHLK